MAPIDLVKYYGSERSFQRTEGETISAISIRVPLSSAYSEINVLNFKLAAIFGITLIIVASLSIYLNKRWVFSPLSVIRAKANAISKNSDLLGVRIDSPHSLELGDLTDSFNAMSSKLREVMDNLDSLVKDRTEALNATNKALSEEVRNHIETISELKIALDDVKTLRGILPICSHCKKIRDDKGYWKRIESYISEHSEADFSHSICEECLEKYYPED